MCDKDDVEKQDLLYFVLKFTQISHMPRIACDVNCALILLDITQVQSRWSKLNREYKTRKGRWENAVAVWQRFHKDIKDLTLWINSAEKVIRETKLPTGDLDIDKAKQEQGVRIEFTVVHFISKCFCIT